MKSEKLFIDNLTSEDLGGIPLEEAKAAASNKFVWIVKNEIAETSFLIRKPTKDEFNKAAASLDDPERRNVAFNNLSLACTLWPKRDEMIAVLDEFPGVSISLGGEILRLAGLVKVTDTKKLSSGK